MAQVSETTGWEAGKPRPPYGTVAHEFPRFDMAYCPPIPAGWREMSWHNDAMPFWLVDERTGIFIDYLTKDLGDFPDLDDDRWFRYQVCEMVPDPAFGPQHADGAGALFCSNDWQEVLRFLAVRERFSPHHGFTTSTKECKMGAPTERGQEPMNEFVAVKIADTKSIGVKRLAQGLADSMTTAMDGCPTFEGIDEVSAVQVESIYRYGVTVEVNIGGQVFLAEFRHADDEVV